MTFSERLENKVTKTELIDRMTRLSQSHCTQVAELQFYGGEGPFLFAMDESDGPPKFFCFAFADTVEFPTWRNLANAAMDGCSVPSSFSR